MDVFNKAGVQALASATSGFGLAAAQRIVEARDGAIWIEPGLVGGATVAFCVPGQIVAEAPQPA